MRAGTVWLSLAKFSVLHAVGSDTAKQPSINGEHMPDKLAPNAIR